MNSDRLLALYDKVAEAPDAIARLRRFVLDLAVRGKLVAQDASDEPASELLKRIAAEKARLLKAGQFREPRNAVEIKRENLPFTPPPHWAWARLIDIARASYGFAFSSAAFNGEKRGMPLIRIRDISKTDTEAYFDGDYDPAYLVCAGDYLVGMDGDFNLRRWAGPDGLLNQRVMRINGWRCEIASEFVRFPLQMVLDHLHGDTSLTTVKHLSAKQVNGIEIPLPPLAEQRRIVAKVEELMALLDRLEAARTAREATRDRLTAASLARLTAPDADPPEFPSNARFALATLPALTTRPDQIKPLRQTILNLAVRGRLVEQDPADEPASGLLKRIATDKRERAVSARERRAGAVKPLDRIDAPFDLPPSWLWVAFGDITISRDGERIPVSKAERENRAKIYDYYGASGVIDKIDGYIFDKPLLLIGEDGANLINRSTPIAFIARGRYWVNNHAHVLDGLNDEYLRYLELFINATDLKPFVTGTAQPKMNQAKMNSIPVALPPLAEQLRIVAKVDALMALCDRLESALATADTTRARLLEALLHEALVPQSAALEAAE
jgi:type I restriction enzyme, S subunit